MPSPAPPTELLPWERAVVLLSCALSALGSGLLVATHALWPDLRSRARRLLLFLSLADLLSAASYFYGVLQDFAGTSWDCVLQGALSTFANTSSFFWTVAIALYLYLSIVRTTRGPSTDHLIWAFHLISWGVPLAITVAAVSLKKIGYDASDVSVGWCWINLEAEDRVLWMLLTGKLWEMLAYILLPLLYLLVRKHINRAHQALSEYRPICEGRQLQRGSSTSTADKKLVLIPLIFICLRVWSTVRFVLTLCGSPAVQTPVLVVLHGIGNTFPPCPYWRCLPGSCFRIRRPSMLSAWPKVKIGAQWRDSHQYGLFYLPDLQAGSVFLAHSCPGSVGFVCVSTKTVRLSYAGYRQGIGSQCPRPPTLFTVGGIRTCGPIPGLTE